MTTENTIIQVENLGIAFKAGAERIHAVNGINFSIQPGEALGVVGESGSGKSVTALAMMGLLPTGISEITSGNIWFGGSGQGHSDLLTLSEKQFRNIRGNKIAMVFQEPMTSLNPVLRCGPQVVEAILCHQSLSFAQAQQKVLQLFEEVKLPDPQKAFRSYPHELSGGQKQRVMIAMAMSCEPALLIADEPTTALDVTVQKGILELMKELQQKHQMAIMFISHDLAVVSDVCSKVVVMRHGEIVEQGKTSEVFNNPSHPYTRALMECRPKPGVRPKTLPTVSDFMEGMSGDGKNSLTAAKPIGARAVEYVDAQSRKQSQEEMYSREPLLRVEDLWSRFPMKYGFWGNVKEWFEAVKNVSLELYPGETLGLVGESGCGKTTLGRTILRLKPMSAGRIFFDGQDISALKGEKLRKLRKSIQVVFQDPYASLSPNMTVGDAIMEVLKVHRMCATEAQRKQRSMELLEKVGLTPAHFYRYPHEFSGGQRQRIVIARALCVEPRLMICDESVSALDVSVQAQVLNLLNKLKADFGFSVLFISHDLSVVNFMADRVLVMKNGEIVEAAEADELFKNPRHSYTKALIEAIPGK